MTVKEYRKKVKLTQLELSVNTGISIQQIQKIEQGKILLHEVKYNTVKKIYQALNLDVSLEYFVNQNDWAIECEKVRKE